MPRSDRLEDFIRTSCDELEALASALVKQRPSEIASSAAQLLVRALHAKTTAADASATICGRTFGLWLADNPDDRIAAVAAEVRTLLGTKPRNLRSFAELIDRKLSFALGSLASALTRIERDQRHAEWRASSDDLEAMLFRSLESTPPKHLETLHACVRAALLKRAPIADAQAATAKPYDFFISYTRSDEHWAEWISWTLEEACYRVKLQKWDFRPGANFVLEMDAAIRQSARTIAVLSPAYLESAYGRAEWPHSTEVALDLNNIAVLFQHMGRLNEAEPLMRRALAIHRDRFGADHPMVAFNLNNLGAILQASGRAVEAEPLLRRALEIDAANHGTDHPIVAGRLSNLALLLMSTGHTVEAETMLRRALAITERTFGPDDPRVAVQLNNLAHVLVGAGQYEAAEPMIRRALLIDTSFYGPTHPTVALRANNLAQLLGATGRAADAESLLRTALNIHTTIFGPRSSQVAVQLNNLGLLLQSQQRFIEAERLMREALAINQSCDTNDDVAVAGSLNNLAMLLQETGRAQDALTLARRAHEIYHSRLGPADARTRGASGNIEYILDEEIGG